MPNEIRLSDQPIFLAMACCNSVNELKVMQKSYDSIWDCEDESTNFGKYQIDEMYDECVFAL